MPLLGLDRVLLGSPELKCCDYAAGRRSAPGRETMKKKISTRDPQLFSARSFKCAIWSLFAWKFLENSLSFSNYLEFLAMRTQICENVGKQKFSDVLQTPETILI